MTYKDEKARSAITERAAEWFAAHEDADPPPNSPEFLDWLKASPMHVEEFLGVATLARDLRLAADDSAFSADSLLERARSDVGEVGSPIVTGPTSVHAVAAHRWRPLVLAATLVLVGTFAILYWQRQTSRSTTEHVIEMRFATRHGEQRTISLPDQSVLHLDTASVLVLRYSQAERRLTLVSGQGEFEVRPDARRAFRVLTDSAEIRDVGTTFNVRAEGDSTQVTVLAGRVAVAPRSAGAPHAPPLELGPDQQLEVTKGHWPAVPLQVNAQRSTAWLRREIVFERTPLEQVAAEINRYATKPIEIDSPALRRLPISGVFATDDTEAFIIFLRGLEGAKVEETATRIRVSQK
jgi:transmembrane sensor